MDVYVLRMFVLKVLKIKFIKSIISRRARSDLLVSLGVRHHGFVDRTCQLESGHGSLLLVLQAAPFLKKFFMNKANFIL